MTVLLNTIKPYSIYSTLYQYFCCDAVPDDIIAALEFYWSLLDEHRDTETLCTEFRLWQQKWRETPQEERPRTAIDGLVKCNPACYPNILYHAFSFGNLTGHDCIS